jgi:hypothetical protein
MYLELGEVYIKPPEVTITNLVNGSTYGRYDPISFVINSTEPLQSFRVLRDGFPYYTYNGINLGNQNNNSVLKFANNGSYIEFTGGTYLHHYGRDFVNYTVQATNIYYVTGFDSVIVEVDGQAPDSGTMITQPNAEVDFGQEASVPAYKMNAGGSLTLQWSYPDPNDITYYIFDWGKTSYNLSEPQITINDTGQFDPGVVYDFSIHAVDQFGNRDSGGIHAYFILEEGSSENRSVPMEFLSILLGFTMIVLLNRYYFK